MTEVNVWLLLVYVQIYTSVRSTHRHTYVCTHMHAHAYTHANTHISAIPLAGTQRLNWEDISVTVFRAQVQLHLLVIWRSTVISRQHSACLHLFFTAVILSVGHKVSSHPSMWYSNSNFKFVWETVQPIATLRKQKAIKYMRHVVSSTETLDA